MQATDPNCIFCKLVRGEIPCKKVFEDADVLAFHDIQPVAPVHFMLVPKKHVATMYDLTPDDAPVMGKIMTLAGRLARELGAGDGFRTIVNTGRVGRQEVQHVHVHVIGGPETLGPMIVRNKLTGLVLLGGKASGEEFSAEDFETISAMVRHIGVGIHTHRLIEQVAQRAEENRRLYEDLRAIYRDTVRAFAAAIDIKDKYTQGHSERVGRYSEIIAREMGWGEDEVEGIQIAGYLHDVGKLVVDRNIINAPYHIDAKLSSELNRHPAAGYEILAPINHPYADIPLMAKYHHERLDGRGYPDGLTDEQIPLGAKIVALADSFDAMTTDRPYRRRRSFEDVVRDLRQSSGTQFDGKVVVAFARAILKELLGEKKDRRIMKMLGKGYLDGQQVPTLLRDLIAELDAEQASVVGS